MGDTDFREVRKKVDVYERDENHALQSRHIHEHDCRLFKHSDGALSRTDQNR